MKTNYSLLFLLILGLVSCSTHQPVQISAITDTPIAIMTISNTPNLAITPTPTYDSWCWKKEKECEIAQKLGVNIQQIESFSPNMQWAVIYLGGMRFVKVDGSKEWEFNSLQMREDIGECGYFLEINFWSLDSRYVYFSPDPSYCSRLRNYSDVGTQVLYRLDVETGEFKEYLPFNKNTNSTTSRKFDLYSLEFSPDGTYLAYLQTLTIPLIVHIRNLETEFETTYTMNMKYPEAGCLAWSAKDHLLFFYVATVTAPEKSLVSSFYKIDVDNHIVKEIVHDKPYLYCISRGDIMNDGDLVFTKMVDTSSGYNENFYFNPYTEEFEIYPTSTPYPSKTSQP